MLSKLVFQCSIIAIIIVSNGCTSEKDTQQKLFDEVMQVHDEVMPKMGELRSLAKQLSNRADSLASDSLAENTTQINEMRDLSKQLNDANEGMMEWMRQFEQIEEGTSHGEVIQYLTEQRKKIQKVRDDMLNSQSEAKEYLMKGDEQR